MNAIFRYELKRNRRSLLVWALCAAGLTVMGYLEYAFVFRSNADVSAIMDALPAPLATLLGITAHVDFSTAPGFYCLMADFAFYVLAAYAVLLGARLVSSEASERTADFLYSLPLSRYAILAAKGCAGAVLCGLLDLFNLLASALTFGTAPGLLGAVLAAAAGSFLMQLVYLTAGALLASLVKRPTGAGGAALIFLFASIFSGKLLAMLGITTGPLLALSGRDYFPVDRWLYGGGFGLWPWLLCAGLAVLFAVGTVACYREKDI